MLQWQPESAWRLRRSPMQLVLGLPPSVALLDGALLGTAFLERAFLATALLGVPALLIATLLLSWHG